jgi:hypothetical protein
VPVTRRHGLPPPDENVATWDSRWESAAPEEVDAAAAAISHADPAGILARHLGARTGSALRSFWNSRAGREEPRPDRCFRDGASSVCPGARAGDCPGRPFPSSLAPPSTEERDDVRVLVVLVLAAGVVPEDATLLLRLWAPSTLGCAGQLAKPIGAGRRDERTAGN